jgi:hypothetical protein
MALPRMSESTLLFAARIMDSSAPPRRARLRLALWRVIGLGVTQPVRVDAGEYPTLRSQFDACPRSRVRAYDADSRRPERGYTA